MSSANQEVEATGSAPSYSVELQDISGMFYEIQYYSQIFTESRVQIPRWRILAPMDLLMIMVECNPHSTIMVSDLYNIK